MRMNSRWSNPSRRKRGPRDPSGGFTATTTCSAPLPVPARSSSPSCASSSFASFSMGMASDLLQLLQHVVDHGVQPEARLPFPLLARGAVVDGLGPGVGDGLPARVDVILDGEGGDALLDGGGD